MSLYSQALSQFKAKKEHEKKNMVSPYLPTGKVRERVLESKKVFERCDLVRNAAPEEFNYLSLQQVISRDRRAFNNYVPPASEDPDESWRANTIRPITRNKVISIAAHIAASVLVPQIYAQNDRDEEDKAAALIMRDLNDWANNQSNYDHEFVKLIVKALVDPAVFMYEGYDEVFRNIKVIQPDGTWDIERVMDDVFSGFKNLIVPVEEIYVPNFYESDIQKQTDVIWRRVTDWDTLVAKYGDNENFQKYCEPGVRVMYVDERDGFYQMYDQNLGSYMGEEVIRYNRLADLELRFVNGVLMDDPDRPIQRMDKRYPFAKIGYEFFAGNDCFYYKSLVDKMSQDQRVIDTLYNMVIDGTFLQIFKPGVISGDEEVDSAVMIPGATSVISGESTFQTIDTKADLNAGMATLQKLEMSASESSTDPRTAGQSGDGTPPTAFEVSQLERNARTVLGLFGKQVAKFVEDFGKLRVSTILQYMTVAESAEILGDSNRLKFRSFLIPSDGSEGSKTKKIEFDMNMPEDKEGQRSLSFKLLEKEERTGMSLAVVNPELFRRNKYMFRVAADFAPNQTDAMKKALNLEAYDRAIVNPLSDQEQVTRDFLFETYVPGESDKYIKKAAPAPAPEQGAGSLQGNSNVTSQILNQAQASGMSQS